MTNTVSKSVELVKIHELGIVRVPLWQASCRL
jgi:hypothetical protein